MMFFKILLSFFILQFGTSKDINMENLHAVMLFIDDMMLRVSHSLDLSSSFFIFFSQTLGLLSQMI